MSVDHLLSPYESASLVHFLLSCFCCRFEFLAYAGCQVSVDVELAEISGFEGAAASLVSCAVPKPFNPMQLHRGAIS